MLLLTLVTLGTSICVSGSSVVEYVDEELVPIC